MVSDGPGRYQSNGGGHGAYAQQTDPKQIKINQFMVEISHMLDEARKQQKFNELTVIASPKTHGELTQHLNKNVEKLISTVIQKDLVFLKQHELQDFLTKEQKNFRL